MDELKLFNVAAKGISLAATATAGSGVEIPGSGTTLRVVNEGPSIAFIAVGGPGVSAVLPTTGVGSPACTPVPAGADITFSREAGQAYISAICRAGGTATLIVQSGTGA